MAGHHLTIPASRSQDVQLKELHSVWHPGIEPGFLRFQSEWITIFPVPDSSLFAALYLILTDPVPSVKLIPLAFCD
jgi:hypothetical protein